jgi:hypothetical protein
MKPLFAPSNCMGTRSPSLILNRISECEREFAKTEPVGEVRRMTDEEREVAITRAADAMSFWKRKGDLTKYGYAKSIHDRLVAGRSVK